MPSNTRGLAAEVPVGVVHANVAVAGTVVGVIVVSSQSYVTAKVTLAVGFTVKVYASGSLVQLVGWLSSVNV
jgi:hypothetical protein